MKLRILGLIAALLTAGSAHALMIDDNHEIGYIQFGIPSGDADRTAYVNHLIDMGLGTTDSALGQTFFRSLNDFGPLSDAVFGSNGTSTSINLGSGDTYQYLFAKYDGPNYGSIVWYVGDLTGIITIPATASAYGLSGWTLFTGTPSDHHVPEPGVLSLFGLGLMGLAFARRTTGH